MTGVSPAPAIQRGQELQHHPEPKRGTRGSHPQGQRRARGLGTPQRNRERPHSHTPHSLTLTHRYAHMHSHVYRVLTHSHPPALPPTSLSLCPQGHCPQTASPLVPPQPCRATGQRSGRVRPAHPAHLGPYLTPVGHGVTLRVQSQTKESLSQAWVGEHPGSSWAEAGGGEAQT